MIILSHNNEYGHLGVIVAKRVLRNETITKQNKEVCINGAEGHQVKSVSE